ncbi:restriction endonuclease subunit S [Paludibacterium denitrificans]|nr:restriction endonuclease subunit S [Paludibacterium denitrificans]
MSEQNNEKSALVPRLRFPEFQETRDLVGVRDFFDHTDTSEKTEAFDKNRLLTVKLHANGVVKNEKTNLTGGANYFNRRAGQFVFSKIDLLNGAFGIVPDALDGFASSSDVPAYSFKSNRSSTFFVNWLKASYERLNIERTGTSTTLKRISPEKFLALDVPVPSDTEQIKIANFLSSIDELFKREVEKLENLKAHKRGLMQHLFPREDETIPRFRFPQFLEASEWKRRKISDLLKRSTKPVDVDSGATYQEIGIRSHGKGLFHKDFVSGKALGDKRVFWVEENAFVVNIVFAWEQAVAVTSMQEKGMIASHRFPMYVAQKSKSNVDFIKYFFLTKKGKELLGIASPGGAGRNKTLGQKDFENLEFLSPEHVEEQAEIARCLSSLDNLIAAQSQKIDAFKIHKKGLMQQLFPVMLEMHA